VRTAGSPVTATAILNAFGDDIADASIRFQVPPELLLMIIATEAAAFRQEGFTGPRTFRWEPSIKDYSAGPMQILSGTARDVNSSESLGLDDTMMPPMKKKPANPPGDLLLYESKAAITIGAAYISRNAKRLDTGNNPIFVSAAFNAGSLRSSPTNLWRIHVFGSHLDRAAEWYSDACIVCDEHLRR
jgi:peptidoglycan L-alanyl-D-glutamate endopeptidase CwlK